MFAILKKEINSFFASPIGYLVIGLFLVVNGLFLWVFKGDYNIVDSGFANLEPFFTLAPWIFLFLIPAITMKSFSEEIKQGTLELLLTKPLNTLELVLGKYFGALSLVILALLPTLLYIAAIYSLGRAENHLDWGVLIGSYFGLLFLGACYTAIGIFASILSPNQIVSFILAIFLCFIAYFAFEGIANLNLFSSRYFSVEDLGLSAHYESISRGIIDTRDLIYFLSLIFFFLALTNLSLNNKKLS
ncbi:gliding motility-associated ABC transporter permease subunit GldF [Salinimicrobium sediminilitoris]|uniref:gliding motility-associated ABC transporter permease subunit GldF n=1 Tax=Salinimicrobium sediminilitoris TaxID=2876715 RepID=UPI001E5AE044|nr:gliding motility-associated ABC transporter permease subunit GldF [Salinimicrobium sediminilitoris]MCC8360142.1 gliding motility-associated ABC transporter permease subunit GldF [Salinimicrobium sediminilitoris]